MKRWTKKLSGIAILAVLLGIWLVLRNSSAKTAAEESGISSQTDSQIDSEEKIGENLKKIFVDYGDERKALEVQIEDDKAHIVDLDETRSDLNVLDKSLEEIQKLAIVRNLGKKEDMAQYGLGEGDGTELSLTEKDNSILTLQIGDPVPEREDSFYAREKSDVVIISSLPSQFLEGRTAFYKKNLISIAPKTDDQGNNTDEFDYLEFGGTSRDDIIRIEPDKEAASGYIMTRPVRAEALLGETNQDVGSVSVYDLLGAVQAEKVIAEECDQKLLEDSGLEDEGLSNVSYSLNGEKHTIRIGREEENGYDLMLDEDPAMYLVSKEWAEKVMNLSVMDLRASYIWLVNLSELESVTVSCGETDKKYQIQKNGDAICEGSTIKKDTFAPKYQELIGMTILNTEEPKSHQKEPVMDIVYCYKADSAGKGGTVSTEASDKVTVEVFPVDNSDRYVAYLDGEFAGTLRSDTVAAVMQDWK